MAYIIIDEKLGEDNDSSDVVSGEFSSLDLVREELLSRGREYDTDEGWGGRSEFDRWKDGITVYEVSSKVPLNIKRGDFVVSFEEPRADIPAPLPGEAVEDYARRITNR